MASIAQAPTPTEPELLAGWPDPKTDLNHLRSIGELTCWDPTDLRSLDRLRARLHDRWLVVILTPGPLTYFALQRSPVPVSRHGPLLRFQNPRYALCKPHAAVLVEASESDRFLYLDPYCPVDGQPFSLTEDELIEAWTGHVMIPMLPVEVVEAILAS